jgi:hypothetical protein
MKPDLMPLRIRSKTNGKDRQQLWRTHNAILDELTQAEEYMRRSEPLAAFRAAFCAHRVPQGVIQLKKEFQDLKLGSMSVNQEF